MELQENRIAIVSPSQNAYSETFIQEQKKGLSGKVYYYFDGAIPRNLEGYGKLEHRFLRLALRIQRKIGIKTLSAAETAFMQSLKKNKVQVVLAQYGTVAYQILKVCKKLNIPLITHFHGYDASVEAVIKKCNNYKEVFEYSSYVIAVSKVMETKLLDLGCSREKLVCNPCAPSDVFLAIEPQFGSETFIGIGRFVNKKAPYYTILAFKKVHEQFPEAKLIIGGTGELYETCFNLVKTLKLEGVVFLPGVIDRTQFVDYLSKGLAFVQHSVTALSGDQEGTPVAILEASAAGLPVIATIHAGIPDVIIDGETGFLVAEHDIEAMAEKMILLLKDNELAKQLGKNGKERMKDNFTLQRHLTVIDELIDKAIKR
ncbi:glycosyltransferase [Flavobacterium adhaerens]|uniref:glycosyltransferase n=1 Tax=Flavobacterium adhaerens TaxID=3149043 RepID=UPI0032B62A3D